MLNKVQLIGHLGADPDVRYTKDQEPVARVRVATTETWKKNGEKQEKTEWHNVVFFGKLAEIVSQYLKKGSMVYVEGKIQTRSWEKDGDTRYSTEIVAENMKMLSGRGTASSSAPAAASTGGSDFDQDPF